MHEAKINAQKWTPPTLGSKLKVPVISLIGNQNILGEYRTLIKKDHSDEEVSVLIITVSKKNKNPFTKDVLKSISRVLSKGGTVVISNPDFNKLPEPLLRWGDKNNISFPTKSKSIVEGVGIVNYNNYRSFTDFPFRLSDQPQNSVTYCWKKWDKKFIAPILSSDKSGALTLLAENVKGKGKLLLTKISLRKCTLYHENLLRWLCGENLLAYSTIWTPTYSMSTEGYTPHKAWAKPYAGKKPKVLYLTLTTSKRGLLELNQRADIDWKYVPYDGTFVRPSRNAEDFPKSRMGGRAVALLEQALPWADVVFFDVGIKNMIRSLTSNMKEGTSSFGSIPGHLRRKIYRLVHYKGIGLVGCSSARATEGNLKGFTSRIKNNNKRISLHDEMSSTIPLPEVAHAGQRHVAKLEAGSFGSGRIIWFDHLLPHHLSSGSRSSPELLPIEDYAVQGLYKPFYPIKLNEYWYAMMAKSVLWAAGVSAKQKIEKVEYENNILKFKINNIDKVQLLSVNIINAWNESLLKKETKIQDRVSHIQLDPLPAGYYIIECKLLSSDKKVIDFMATKITVNKDVFISEMKSEKHFYDIGEKAKINFKFSEVINGELKVTAKDTWGRITWKSEGIKFNKDECEVPIQISSSYSRIWDIEATLVIDGKALHVQRIPIGVRLPEREKDLWILEGSLSRDEEIHIFNKAVGIDYSFYDVERSLRANIDISSVASMHSTAFAPSLFPGERTIKSERVPCISSPTTRLRVTEQLKKKGGKLKDLGVMEYTIDDECVLSGYCTSNYCLMRFRYWLKKEYDSLENLNKEWKTQFKSWHKILPRQISDSKYPGSYVDFKYFNAWKFSEFSSHVEIEAGNYINNFKSGHSSCPVGGFLEEHAGLIYYYDVNETTVGIARPDTMIGSWYGPGYRFVENHETTSRKWAWKHLFRGTTRIALWHSEDGTPGYYGDFSRPYMAHVWLGEEMRDIRLGIGKLLMNTPRLNGPVASYSSLRNKYVKETILELDKKETKNGNKRITFLKARSNLLPAFLDTQVECRAMSPTQLLDGALELRKNKILLLQGVLSLSKQEKNNIKEFVNHGGIVVADVNIGTRNEHGTYVGDGFAKEVFGVTITEGLEKVQDKIKLNLNEKALEYFPKLHVLKTLNATYIGTETKAIHAKACGTFENGKSALYVNKVGKGYGVLLNFVTPKDGEYINSLCLDILSLGKVEPRLKVLSSTGERFKSDFGSYQQNNVFYSGFVVRPKGGMLKDEDVQIAKVIFPKKGYVYDARKGKYLGYKKELETKIVPSIAHVYALLPGELKAIDIKGMTEVHKGQVLKLKVRSVSGAGTLAPLQVLKIIVKNSRGEEVACYTKRLMLYGGETAIDLPIAYNANSGVWQVSLRDAATGVTGQYSFSVL